jgi:hypothetical protein
MQRRVNIPAKGREGGEGGKDRKAILGTGKLSGSASDFHLL